MPAARGDFDCQEGGHDGRGEAVEGGVDVPSVEPRVCEVVGFGDGGGVEGFVVGVAEGDVLKAFVGRHKAVADDLDLGLVGDCFEVGVEDGAFGVYCFAMTIRGCEGVEAVGELVLGAWGDVGLGFEDYDLVGEEGVTDEGKVGVWVGDVSGGCSGVSLMIGVAYRGGYRFHGYSPFSTEVTLFHHV